MRPHYSQSSRENETPSSGTSPLDSYKEVPPPPGGGVKDSISVFTHTQNALVELWRRYQFGGIFRAEPEKPKKLA